jgi:hypothetical protein
MTAHYLDDKQPEAAHAASEYEPDEQQPNPWVGRWGFSSREQAGETLADWACIALVLGFAAWVAFA